mgnify:CR=1 FL=1
MHVMLIVLSAGTCRVHASIVASVCECLLGVSLVDTCYAEVALGWNMMVPLYLGIVLVSTCDWTPYGLAVWFAVVLFRVCVVLGVSHELARVKLGMALPGIPGYACRSC